jgi:hypothetical protein
MPERNLRIVILVPRDEYLQGARLAEAQCRTIEQQATLVFRRWVAAAEGIAEPVPALDEADASHSKSVALLDQADAEAAQPEPSLDLIRDLITESGALNRKVDALLAFVRQAAD